MHVSKNQKDRDKFIPLICSRIGPLFRSNWALPFFTFSMGDILVYPWTLSIWLLRLNDSGTSVLDHRKRVVEKDELAQRKI